MIDERLTLDSLLRDLHEDNRDNTSVHEDVDWEDAPLPYKLYRGLPAVPLSSEVPLELSEPDPGNKPDLNRVGHFLWFAYGLTQLSQPAAALDPAYPMAGSMRMIRRFVPSGGGLYPNELYVYLKINGIATGVYHYDAAHHRLVLLREGEFDCYLTSALGFRCDMSACFGAVFVSTMVWKNFFKYQNFACRLQGLDCGILIGQILEGSKRFGITADVYYQFLDRPVNHLLGLSDREETVYACIPLWETGTMGSRTKQRLDRSLDISAADLCRELPEVKHTHYVRSRRVKEYSMPLQLNEASMLETSGSFRLLQSEKDRDSGLRANYLPGVQRLSYDFASVCRKRFSPETEFVLGKVTEHDLARMLQEATASFSYRNDLEARHDEPYSRISLYACVSNVDGVPDGAYRYDPAAHALRRIVPGDHRSRLQKGMPIDNVNLFQVPLCIHLAGDKEFLKPALGYRGYRILHMEAGILVHRLLLAASALGMGGRPLLGFSSRNTDELYNLMPQGKTSLIQIPIGPYRSRPRLEGGLHS